MSIWLDKVRAISDKYDRQPFYDVAEKQQELAAELVVAINNNYVVPREVEWKVLFDTNLYAIICVVNQVPDKKVKLDILESAYRSWCPIEESMDRYVGNAGIHNFILTLKGLIIKMQTEIGLANSMKGNGVSQDDVRNDVPENNSDITNLWPLPMTFGDLSIYETDRKDHFYQLEETIRKDWGLLSDITNTLASEGYIEDSIAQKLSFVYVISGRHYMRVGPSNVVWKKLDDLSPLYWMAKYLYVEKPNYSRLEVLFPGVKIDKRHTSRYSSGFERDILPRWRERSEALSRLYAQKQKEKSE